MLLAPPFYPVSLKTILRGILNSECSIKLNNYSSSDPNSNYDPNGNLRQLENATSTFEEHLLIKRGRREPRL